MEAFQALLPLLGLIAAGGAVMLLVRLFRKKGKGELPNDPLADYFIHDDESV